MHFVKEGVKSVKIEATVITEDTTRATLTPDEKRSRSVTLVGSGGTAVEHMKHLVSVLCIVLWQATHLVTNQPNLPAHR